MFRAMVMVMIPKKKERTVKGDRCNPAKDLLTVKSVFFLKHKEGKIVMNGDTYLGWIGLVPFVES